MDFDATFEKYDFDETPELVAKAAQVAFAKASGCALKSGYSVRHRKDGAMVIQLDKRKPVVVKPTYIKVDPKKEYTLSHA